MSNVQIKHWGSGRVSGGLVALEIGGKAGDVARM